MSLTFVGGSYFSSPFFLRSLDGSGAYVISSSPSPEGAVSAGSAVNSKLRTRKPPRRVVNTESFLSSTGGKVPTESDVLDVFICRDSCVDIGPAASGSLVWSPLSETGDNALFLHVYSSVSMSNTGAHSRRRSSLLFADRWEVFVPE